MNRSLPIHHQLPESTQTHVHQVGDAIQTSRSLSSPCPSAPSPSQHQGLFQWVSSSHQVANILEFQLQHQSFQWTLRTDLLQDLLHSKGLSRVLSNTIVQKHQFLSTQLSFREGNGNPLQYSCLENSMSGRTWRAAVLGIAKSQIWLSDFTIFLPIVLFGEGNGNPLQCSCLGNSMDGEACWAADYGVAKSGTRLNN